MRKMKIRAVLIHVGISVFVAFVVAWTIYMAWFPWPYSELSGGNVLFLLIAFVNLVLGPILTWIVFNPSKKRKERFFDAFLLGIIQAIALAYGLHSAYLARPIYLVHEVDRFIIVAAADVDDEALRRAPVYLQNPRTGFVKIIGLREITNSEERMRSIELSMYGQDLSLRPEYWQNFSDDNKKIATQRARPLTNLLEKNPSIKDDVAALIAANKKNMENLVYLPVVGRKKVWTAVMDKKDFAIIDFLKVDGF